LALVAAVTSGTIEVQIGLYRADGTYLGTRSGDETRLRAFEFRQISEIMKPYGTIADGYAVIRTTTPGGRHLALERGRDRARPAGAPGAARPREGSIAGGGVFALPGSRHVTFRPRREPPPPGRIIRTGIWAVLAGSVFLVLPLAALAFLIWIGVLFGKRPPAGA